MACGTRSAKAASNNTVPAPAGSCRSETGCAPVFAPVFAPVVVSSETGQYSVWSIQRLAIPRLDRLLGQIIGGDAHLIAQDFIERRHRPLRGPALRRPKPCPHRCLAAMQIGLVDTDAQHGFRRTTLEGAARAQIGIVMDRGMAV